ncbi:hypothetical protein LRY60_00225 [Candidatus Woesebacteria bacterium]|nr:hypothetical protein [Candidatus Woesebacteria bacterium]
MSVSYREQLQQTVSGKRILVFGVGKQGGGTGVAQLLHSFGAHVRITDQKTASELELEKAHLAPEIEQRLGTHDSEDIAWAE